MLRNPSKTKATQTIEIKGVGPKTEKSCPVTNKKIAPKIAKNIQTVCILCSIIKNVKCKNSKYFLHFSKNGVDLHASYS